MICTNPAIDGGRSVIDGPGFRFRAASGLMVTGENAAQRRMKMVLVTSGSKAWILADEYGGMQILF